MHRQNLLQKLREYQTRWPQEHAIIQDFVTFVTHNEDCFQRSLSTGHITGSAWLVNKAGTHTLLTHHKKLNKWLQLGGHADGDPDTLAVALREAEEESGISAIIPLTESIFDIDIHTIPARKTEPEHKHYDIRYLLRTTNSEAYSVSDESNNLSWVPLEQLADYTQEISMLRMAEKHQALIPK